MYEDSTSGPIGGQFITDNDIRTTYEEVSSRGFSRLVKTRRQGRWFMLKGLKEGASSIYLEFLKKEFALMADLDHPNIVKAFAKEINKELGPCIVMEYVDGMTLDEFLKTDPSKAARKKVVDQIADAVSYIHSKQVLHRDLKPANILVTRNGGNVKILDFGLSDSDDYAILKQSAGTVAYISPEQLSGEKIDARSDQYSFGLILRKIFPRRYRHIASKCTRTDPEKRYPDMLAVRKAIRHNDLWRRASIFIVMGVLLVAGWLTAILRTSDPEPSAASVQESISADQKEYFAQEQWYNSNALQQIISDTEKKGAYREVMMARLANTSVEMQERSKVMSNLYGQGSPEQLYFLSMCADEQGFFRIKASKAIEQNCPSFEEEFRKGRLSSRACDSLRWIMSPSIFTQAVKDITTTTAVGGLELPVDEFSKGTRIGLCWGPCHRPTTKDKESSLDLSGKQGSVVISGLAPNTTYFVRAFVETEAGTTYGNEVSFTTEDSALPTPEGAVPGLFSTGPGSTVYFSKGNLQYQASTDTWRFALHPYDFVGKDNKNISSDWSGWIDLFGWGTSGFDHGAENYQPWSENLDIQSNERHKAYGKMDSCLYEQSGQADWGYNRIQNGGNQENLWRTPRLSEWIYLLFIRDTASGARFAKAIVAGVNGLIILPDNWKASIWPMNAINQGNNQFDANNISKTDWESYLEPAGAAFLPEAGARTISDIFQSLGGYYSSDAATSDAWHLIMDINNLFLDANGHRGDGLSVRLVQDSNE